MIRREILSKIWVPFRSTIRHFRDEKQQFSVSVIGAAGGIGQPLSMLLRCHPQVAKLTLYDLKLAHGVAVDLSHMDMSGLTVGYCGDDLKKAIACQDIIVVPAGMPRKPGQSRDDLFKVNAEVVSKIADQMALLNPRAFLVVITNPINSIIPAVSEVLKQHNVFDPARVFGVTTLDLVRTRKFIGDYMKRQPKRFKIPVIGGHSADTIIPLISHCEPEFKGDEDVIEAITKRIRNGGTEVVEAKDGSGSATLSMAYAGSRFVDSLLKAMNGDPEIRATAYVKNCVTETEYFASEFNMNSDGIADFRGIPPLSCYEKVLLDEAMPIIKKDIEQGEEFGKAFKISSKDGNSC